MIPLTLTPQYNTQVQLDHFIPIMDMVLYIVGGAIMVLLIVTGPLNV